MLSNGYILIVIWAAVMGAMAVSYTHLDVYKRQPRMCLDLNT